MLVRKRDGRSEPVAFDKITARIKKLCYGFDPAHVDPTVVAQKVVVGVYDGVTTVQLDDLGSGYARRYRDRAVTAPQIFVRVPDGPVRSFSRGRHRGSLEACGVPADDAAKITFALHRELVEEKTLEVGIDELRLKTYTRLRSDLGEDSANRYLVWEQFRHGDRPLVLLIGGTTGTGKSTLATRAAQSPPHAPQAQASGVPPPPSRATLSRAHDAPPRVAERVLAPPGPAAPRALWWPRDARGTGPWRRAPATHPLQQPIAPRTLA